jgi:very-short-patch-repair endonuclease
MKDKGPIKAGANWKRCVPAVAPAKDDGEYFDCLEMATAVSLAQLTIGHYMGAIERIAHELGSVPEKAFLCAFVVEAARSFGEPCVMAVSCPDHKEMDGTRGLDRVAAYKLCPQHKIGKFMADFYIESPMESGAIVAVEIDGHDFHEKTKEQVAKDKKRERQIVTAGVPVLRFSGSEIYRDAQACAVETLEFIGAEGMRIWDRNTGR